MAVAYAFEAKSIQSYILDGGKLRDIGGASALIDSFCSYPSEGDSGDDLLAQVLQAVGWTNPRAPRRAGGAFILTASDEDAATLERFRVLWTLVAQLRAPGVQFVEAIGRADGTDEATAIGRATRALLTARNRPYPEMPATSPLARRSPRTGRAACETCRITGELIDPATVVRRGQHRAEGDSLTAKFGGPVGVKWPERMDEEEDAGRTQSPVFPLLRDSRYIGVVHADANRLGEVLVTLHRKLKQDGNAAANYSEHLLAFSRAVAVATQKAAAEATDVLSHAYQETFEPGRKIEVMPMRPILLGGDDLTVIVRADLAIPFTSAFLRAFTRNTHAAFSELQRIRPALVGALPNGLSAGAGIAFVKSTQPFHLAHHLAESLAAFAKQRAKAAAAATAETEGKAVISVVPPSCLAFHRVTTTMIGDYGMIRERELTAGVGSSADVASERCLLRIASLNPYLVEPGEVAEPSFPRLDALRSFVSFIAGPDVSRGPLRRLAELAQVSPAEGERVYRRWRDVMRARDKQAETNLLDAFDRHLHALGCTDIGSHPAVLEIAMPHGHWRRAREKETVDQWEAGKCARLCSPIPDALACLAVWKGGAPMEPGTDERAA